MKSHSYDLRQKAIEQWRSGRKKSEISRALGVDYDTLLGWIKRYAQEGDKGLKVRYSNCGQKTKSRSEVRSRAEELMRQHEEWGSGYLRLSLGREFPDEPLVTVRQLQRWVSDAQIRDKRTKLPPVGMDWERRPFARVQLDANERLVTQDGLECCYLNFIDEYTGAALDAFVFPPRKDQSSTGGYDL